MNPSLFIPAILLTAVATLFILLIPTMLDIVIFRLMQILLRDRKTDSSVWIFLAGTIGKVAIGIAFSSTWIPPLVIALTVVPLQFALLRRNGKVKQTVFISLLFANLVSYTCIMLLVRSLSLSCLRSGGC